MMLILPLLLLLILLGCVRGNVFVTFDRLTVLDVAVNSVMKRLIVGAAIGALALGTATAGQPIGEQKTQADNADYEYVTVTGSHLKQKARKRNIITVTPHGNLLTIDQREMERNGNGQIADQLNRYPGISISRH
jgi:outer membrane receptor for Fe3+-dicitrate